MNMAQEMMRLTLDIVGRTLFDVELLGKADSLGRDITHAQDAAVLQMQCRSSCRFSGNPKPRCDV